MGMQYEQKSNLEQILAGLKDGLVMGIDFLGAAISYMQTPTTYPQNPRYLADIGLRGKTERTPRYNLSKAVGIVGGGTANYLLKFIPQGALLAVYGARSLIFKKRKK